MSSQAGEKINLGDVAVDPVTARGIPGAQHHQIQHFKGRDSSTLMQKLLCGCVPKYWMCDPKIELFLKLFGSLEFFFFCKAGKGKLDECLRV